MSLYIALEGAGLDWDDGEMERFHRYYNQGHGYKTISKYLKRSQTDVIAFALDQLRLDHFKLVLGVTENESTGQPIKKSS